MAMDFDQCVAFVRKHASKSEFHGLTQAPSTQYGKTKINLTYYSMPDWLAVISAARWPKATGSGEEPLRDVLGAIAMESDISAVLGFMKLLDGQPIGPATLFPQLVLAYKTAVNQHRNSVAGFLNDFTHTGSGQALLAELGRSHRSITVMPHWHHFIALPGEGYRNASARGIHAGQALSHVTDGIHNDDRDAYAKGALIKTIVAGETGTGKGANAMVYYSAGAFTDPRFIDGRMTDPMVGSAGFQADVVLYHELAHATRITDGKETSIPVEGRPNFENIEEYFATVLANIYLSESRRDAAPLRAVYAVPTHPTKGWSEMQNPDTFYDNADKLSIPPRELMDTFLATQPNFYEDLRLLSTPPKFNPPREHFERAQRMRAISNQRIPI